MDKVTDVLAGGIVEGASAIVVEGVFKSVECAVWAYDKYQDTRARKKLFEGACEGSLKKVNKAVARGLSLDCYNFEGDTPLCLAAGHGHHKIVRLMVSRGATVDAPDKSRRLPLVLAALNHHPEVVEMLIEASANVTLLDGEGYLPLEQAMLAISDEAFQALFILANSPTRLWPGKPILTYKEHLVHATAAWGSAVALATLVEKLPPLAHYKDGGGLTPIHHAAAFGRSENLQVLREAGADFEERGVDSVKAIGRAVVGAHESAVSLLVDLNVSLAEAVDDGDSLVLAAVKRGNFSIAERLIRGGADVKSSNELGETPLGFAVEAAPISLIRSLLAAGADPTQPHAVASEPRPLLLTAIKRGDEAITELVLTLQGAKQTDKKGWLPLHEAVKRGQVGIVLQLLSIRPDLVNEPTLEGETPAYLAACFGNRTLIEMLRNAGADFNPDETLCHPLLGAASKGHTEVMEWLVSLGVRPCLSHAGWTALHEACAGGHLSAFEYAYSYIKNVDMRTDAGEWPIHLAARTENFSLLRSIIAKGARLDVRTDMEGRTALLEAAQFGQTSCLQVLLDAGASHEEMDRLGFTPILLAASEGHLSLVDHLMRIKRFRPEETSFAVWVVACCYGQLHFAAKKYRADYDSLLSVENLTLLRSKFQKVLSKPSDEEFEAHILASAVAHLQELFDQRDRRLNSKAERPQLESGAALGSSVSAFTNRTEKIILGDPSVLSPTPLKRKPEPLARPLSRSFRRPDLENMHKSADLEVCLDRLRNLLDIASSLTYHQLIAQAKSSLEELTASQHPILRQLSRGIEEIERAYRKALLIHSRLFSNGSVTNDSPLQRRSSSRLSRGNTPPSTPSQGHKQYLHRSSGSSDTPLRSRSLNSSTSNLANSANSASDSDAEVVTLELGVLATSSSIAEE